MDLTDVIGGVFDFLRWCFGGRKRWHAEQAAKAQAEADESSSRQTEPEDTTRTATAKEAAHALRAYIRQTSGLNGADVNDAEQFLDAHDSLAGEASLWLSEMATTSEDQDYLFYGSLSPEKLRLELVLDITSEEALPTIADTEAVEIVQAAAQALKGRSEDT